MNNYLQIRPAFAAGAKVADAGCFRPDNDQFLNMASIFSMPIEPSCVPISSFFRL